jgi:hypothetical protein
MQFPPATDAVVMHIWSGQKKKQGFELIRA